MADPIADMVGLLRPSAPFSKLVSGAGPWRVRRAEKGRPFYCLILEGSCRLHLPGQDGVALHGGDFVLIPSAYDFEMASLDPPPPGAETQPVAMPGGDFRLGRPDAAPDIRLLVGYCVLGSPDAGILVSLLPQLVHVRGENRLATLVTLVADEARANRPGREVVLARLLEVLLIEAIRSSGGTEAPPGLVRGLADPHVATALRRIHGSPTEPLTVAQLAREAALSRSTFFERFNRCVGATPMDYVTSWRMALAKDRLRRRDKTVAEVAELVGYGSASAFSVAFTRHVGVPPARYAREPLVEEAGLSS